MRQQLPSEGLGSLVSRWTGGLASKPSQRRQPGAPRVDSPDLLALRPVSLRVVLDQILSALHAVVAARHRRTPPLYARRLL